MTTAQGINSERPPVIYSAVIKPEHIDYNNHLNSAAYVLLFEYASESLFLSIGLGEEVTKTTNISTAVLESHIVYHREVLLGTPVDISARLLDYDHKSLHLRYQLYANAEEKYLAATMELITICMDLNRRRSGIFPENVQARVQQLFEQQRHLPKANQVCANIGVRRKVAVL